MLHKELTLFSMIIVVFIIGWAFSLYLHKKFWMYRQSTMGFGLKLMFIVQLVVLAIIYGMIIAEIFKTESKDKTTIIARFAILFICNIIFFGLIYFILYLFNNQEYGKTDENVVIASSLPGRYIQMIYLSMVTFFTVGYSNLVPFGISSRIITVIQILTAYVISAFLYSRSSILFNIK